MEKQLLKRKAEDSLSLLSSNKIDPKCGNRAVIEISDEESESKDSDNSDCKKAIEIIVDKLFEEGSDFEEKDDDINSDLENDQLDEFKEASSEFLKQFILGERWDSDKKEEDIMPMVDIKKIKIEQKNDHSLNKFDDCEFHWNQDSIYRFL